MATITEDYISFEVAKLLKEKGFDAKCDKCYAYFADDDIRFLNLKYPKSAQLLIENRYPCITLQMAMKWLREIHNLVVNPVTTSTGTRCYGEWEADIYYRDSGIDATINACGHIYGETYEEACDAGIRYCLEHLI